MIEQISFEEARRYLVEDDLLLDEAASSMGGSVRSELLRYVVYTWWSDERLRPKLSDTNILRVIRRFIKPLRYDAGQTSGFDTSDEYFEVDSGDDLAAMLEYGDLCRIGEKGLAPSPSHVVEVPGTNDAFLISGVPTKFLPTSLGDKVHGRGRVRTIREKDCLRSFPEQSWDDFYPYSGSNLATAVEQILDAKHSSLMAIPSSESLQVDLYDPTVRFGSRWQPVDASEAKVTSLGLCRKTNRVTNQSVYFLAVGNDTTLRLADLNHSEYRMLATWIDLKAERSIQPEQISACGHTFLSFMRLPPDPLLWVLNMFGVYEMAKGKRKLTTFVIPDDLVVVVSSLSNAWGVPFDGRRNE